MSSSLLAVTLATSERMSCQSIGLLRCGSRSHIGLTPSEPKEPVLSFVIRAIVHVRNGGPSMQDIRILGVAALLFPSLACENLQPTVLEQFQVDSGIDAPLGRDSDEPVDTVIPYDPSNSPPRANAGPDLYDMLPGDLVSLDGTSSSDLDGDDLEFEWRLITRPAGSVATITNADFDVAQLYVDRAGIFEVELWVTDGTADDTDMLSIYVDDPNQRPEADAGLDQRVSKGSVVQLSGAASSDPEGDDLEYFWEFINKPSTSVASLTNNSVQPALAPRFTADQAGVFTIQLTVSDGLLDSTPDLVSITVEDPNSGTGTGGNSGGSSDCLDCSAEAERELARRWSAGDAASSLGLLALPFVSLLIQRRRED
jgi:hypothetical protein